MGATGKKASWRRTDARLLAAMLALALALAGFAYLAAQVMAGRTLAIDRWLLLRFRSDADLQLTIGPRWFARTMVDLTALGGGPVLALVTLFVAGYLVSRRKIALGLFVAASIAAGGLSSELLKSAFVRARPDVVPHLVEVTSASFPSGHAMNSAMVYLTAAALVASAERSARVRLYLMGSAALLTLGIGFSRVYLGVHFPTDVLAGWAVGAAWALGCTWIAAILQRRHTLEGAEGTTTSIAR